MRNVYYCVLDVLLENKINFTGVAGVSAGTAFASSVMIEKDPAQIKRVYQVGRKEMQKQLSKLKLFLGEEK